MDIFLLQIKYLLKTINYLIFSNLKIIKILI